LGASSSLLTALLHSDSATGNAPRVRSAWRSRSHFAWQTGYSAFSVSKSQVDRVKRYIENQEEHHGKVTFQEEVLALLKKQGIKYDPRYVFG